MAVRRKTKPVVEDLVQELKPQERLLTKIRVDLKCKNDRQKNFIRLINKHDIVVCAGPAGTGKTFVACAEALKLLTSQNHKYKKIIIVKSVTVLEGEEIGFLKGTMKEKMEPFMISFLDNFHKLIGKEMTGTMLNCEMIEVLPLAYVRGRSIDNAKIIITGDTKQIDMRAGNTSSLEKVVQYFTPMEEVGIMEFGREDIVRNPLIIKIEEIFEKHMG